MHQEKVRDVNMSNKLKELASVTHVSVKTDNEKPPMSISPHMLLLYATEIP